MPKRQQKNKWFKETFMPNNISIILSLVILFILTIISSHGVCIDKIDAGYCITYHGQPFDVYVTGETANIPQEDMTNLWVNGVLGFIGNAIIVYLVISVLVKLVKKN